MRVLSYVRQQLKRLAIFLAACMGLTLFGMLFFLVATSLFVTKIYVYGRYHLHDKKYWDMCIHDVHDQSPRASCPFRHYNQQTIGIFYYRSYHENIAICDADNTTLSQYDTINDLMAVRQLPGGEGKRCVSIRSTLP